MIQNTTMRDRIDMVKHFPRTYNGIRKQTYMKLLDNDISILTCYYSSYIKKLKKFQYFHILVQDQINSDINIITCELVKNGRSVDFDKALIKAINNFIAGKRA